MSATALLTRRYLAEYARRPINLVLLVVVPMVFVGLASDAILNFAELLGGTTDTSQLASVTAGWAAAFLAGVSGFFHVFDSREVDRRVAAAGMGTRRIASARLLSGLCLVLLASAAAVIALVVRNGIDDPGRALAGTVMFAVIYLGIGVTIGAVVKSDINGSLVVVFIWMLDVFLGPSMAGSDIWITRLFPTHFVSLVMSAAGSDHGGPLSDLGWSAAWTLGAVGVAAAVFATATSNRRALHPSHHQSVTWRRMRAGLRFGFREYRRNIAMWVMLIVLPVFFISLSFYITPNDPAPIEVHQNGVTTVKVVTMIDVHGALMVPITIGFLAGLAGLFVVQGSLQADARLALAGFRSREILASRLGVISLAALLTTAVSLAVTAVDFEPQGWVWFTVGNALVALTYGMVGVLVGVLFGRLGGLYVMFLIPFIDVGLGQNVMFSAAPPAWGIFLPARGSAQILVDAAFTPDFDQTNGLILALAWLIGLIVVTSIVFRRIAEPSRA